MVINVLDMFKLNMVRFVRKTFIVGDADILLVLIYLIDSHYTTFACIRYCLYRVILSKQITCTDLDSEVQFMATTNTAMYYYFDFNDFIIIFLIKLYKIY